MWYIEQQVEFEFQIKKPIFHWDKELLYESPVGSVSFTPYTQASATPGSPLSPVGSPPTITYNAGQAAGGIIGFIVVCTMFVLCVVIMVPFGIRFVVLQIKAHLNK